MEAKSHGRRWKFRIDPLRRKLEEGFNPYLSDSDSSEEEDGSEGVDASEVSGGWALANYAGVGEMQQLVLTV